MAGVWGDCIRETHTELRRLHSHLTLAYLSGIVMKRWTRAIAILWLQVQDAQRKGGARMVLAKTARRVSSGLVKALWGWELG